MVFGMSTQDYPLFKQILYCKGKWDTITNIMLYEVLHLACADEDLFKYIYDTKPPTYQFARFTDWFYDFAQQQL